MDGHPYVNRCPSGLYFDDISKFCTFKAEARCGPLASSKILTQHTLISKLTSKSILKYYSVATYFLEDCRFIIDDTIF